MVRHEKLTLFEPFFFMQNGAAQKTHAFWTIFFVQNINGVARKTHAFWTVFFLQIGAARKTHAFEPFFVFFSSVYKTYKNGLQNSRNWPNGP